MLRYGGSLPGYTTSLKNRRRDFAADIGCLLQINGQKRIGWNYVGALARRI